MNATLLQDYTKRLEIAKAKIEVCDMMIEQITDRSELLRSDDDIATRIYANIMHEFELQKLFIAAYSNSIKQQAHDYWKQLEPQPEDYGWQTGDKSWDNILNAQSYNMARERWQEIEPFKTAENDHN